MSDDVYGPFRRALIEAGLLIPSGQRGLYGRSGGFERVVRGFEALVTRAGAADASEEMHFPPVFSRGDYRKLSHLHNFPDLIGSVHAFTGNEADHRRMAAKFDAGEDWSTELVPSPVVMIPAACYPLFAAATGVLSAEGRTVDLFGFVFRHEPSDDPARMLIFRQRERVRIGTAQQALAHRDASMKFCREVLESVGLPVQLVVANDPFFGRGGRLAKATQREQDLKYELVLPICSEEKPTAIASCNYHLEYFGVNFDIFTPDGDRAHSACFGFGVERVALALFKTHGLDAGQWPLYVREALGL